MIVVQLGYLGRNFENKSAILEENGTLLLPPCFEELEIQKSYGKIYEEFNKRIHNS